MPHQPRPPLDAPTSAADHSPTAPLRVLVLDDKPQTARLVAQCTSDKQASFTAVRTLAEAREQLQSQKVDLLVVEATVAEGAALELVRELQATRTATQTVVVTADARLETAIQAIRLGATDFLVKPLRVGPLTECLRRVEARRQARHRSRVRSRRLRKLCRRLNEARREVNQQVDVLCNDLVLAYQELAAQMNHVVQSSEFTAIVRQELDLEELIRKTLQYLLDKAGPTNAALFLPSGDGEYTLGGYVNYELGAESPDLLLNHLADVLACRAARTDEVLQFTDNTMLRQWLGDDSAYLADSHVLAFATRHKGETLAVLALFRDGSQPYDAAMIEVCRAVAAGLGPHLARIIRVHHRQLPTE